MLYELQEQADRSGPEQMRETLQGALDLYKPMCNSCAIALSRHHSYGRGIITNYGEMRLSIPVFRCGDCGSMASGMKLVGDVERGRQYSKKRGKKR